MRILVLPSFYPSPSKPYFGIFAKDQAQALHHGGLETHVAYFDSRSLRDFSARNWREYHYQMDWSEEDGVPTLRWKGWNTVAQTKLGGLAWSRLAQSLVSRYIGRFGKPDIIHAHNVLWAGHAATRAGARHGVPVVITEHSSIFPFKVVPKNLEKAIAGSYEGAKTVVAVSPSLLDSMRPYLGGARATVVPNVVDTDYYQPTAEVLPDRPFVFLAVATLNKNKGIDILLRAFAARFRGDGNARLHIGGEGPERGPLEALAGTLEIADQVNFLGPLRREGVRGAMWGAHALVVASYHETFSIVLVEALSTGLPVIATRCGGPDSIVAPEVGVLVEPGNVEQMAAALAHCRDSGWPDKAELRDFAVKRYGRAAMVAQLEQIYRAAKVGT